LFNLSRIELIADVQSFALHVLYFIIYTVVLIEIVQHNYTSHASLRNLCSRCTIIERNAPSIAVYVKHILAKRIA